MRAYPLNEYIKKFFKGDRKEFANYLGVNRQQVDKWIRNDFIVYEQALYSKRRDFVTSFQGGGNDKQS